MSWIFLVLAGLCEVGFTTSMKLSEQFTRPHWTASFLACAIASFALLALAIRTIPLGSAYAVWTGLGAAGTILVGILLFKEEATPARLFFLAMIVAGVIGLKLSTNE